MADTIVPDELWEEFHEVVNMTSQELRDWLATSAAGPQSEAFVDQAGSERSRTILEVLGKRRTDLTEDDVAVMRGAVEKIRDARGTEPESRAGDEAWRHRLMSLGHDPLKKPTA